MLGITLLKSIDVSSYTFTDCHSSVRDGYYYLVDKSFFSNIAQYKCVKLTLHIYLHDRSLISQHLTQSAIFPKQLLNLTMGCPVTLLKKCAQKISVQLCQTTLTYRNLKLRQRKVPQLYSKTTSNTKKLIRVPYHRKMVRISFEFGKLCCIVLLFRPSYNLISLNLYKRY